MTHLFIDMYRTKLIDTIKITVVDQQEEKPPFSPFSFWNYEEHVWKNPLWIEAYDKPSINVHSRQRRSDYHQ
jgi:hypothetical protein